MGCGSGCLALVAGIFAIGVISSVLGTLTDNRAARQVERDTEARAERLAELRETFLDSADAIIADARARLSAGQVEAARVRLAPYAQLPGPPELVALRDSIAAVQRETSNAAREQEILETLRTVPAEDAERNAALYGTLVELRPGNDAYRQRRDTYQARVGAARRREFAQRYETELLRSGMDVEVTTRGGDAKTLRLQYVLFGRVWAQRFTDDRELWQNLRSQGFNRLEMTDGFDFSWAWTFPSPEDVAARNAAADRTAQRARERQDSTRLAEAADAEFLAEHPYVGNPVTKAYFPTADRCWRTYTSREEGVFFRTREEAEAAGYRRSNLCR